MSAENRLAVYGSLAPGKSNHHQLAGLAGAWKPGVVRGEVFEEGWGAIQGYPGLRLDPAGREIAVQVFTSPGLPAHWARLDRFEGAEYRRVITTVIGEDGPVEAYIYAIARPKT
jgi:gamma-glutamylcyclotransferase (GGCT)/AIG2-like uncharacterized protein YtfP